MQQVTGFMPFTPEVHQSLSLSESSTKETRVKSVRPGLSNGLATGLQGGVFNLRTALKGGVSSRSQFYDESHPVHFPHP